jgi:class 3 adenylate cyclase
MPEDAGAPYPYPQDPALADVAEALHTAGHWALIVDDRWNLVYVTDELRLTFGANIELAPFAIGRYFLGEATALVGQSWRFGMNSTDLFRLFFAGVGPYVLADTPGGRDALRAAVDASLRDLIDDIQPAATTATAFRGGGMGLDRAYDLPMVALRIRDASGRLAGTAIISKPPAGMALLGAVTAMNDPAHFQRMQLVARAARRPTAILFADLEGSSSLARRLSTASYFALGRRLVRAADQCVIDAGGLVGRHVGDGVVAFFLAETSGSESAAARACVEAARALRASLADVARRTELGPDDVVLRFGLHWGSTLHVGNITTGARSEVTALGDEVNEAARIEACATGGRALASKALIERLTPADALALGLDPDHTAYTALADLATATDKARRDAPSIAVCEVGD